MKDEKIEGFLDTVYNTAEEKSRKMIREIDRAGKAALREYKADLRRSAEAERRRELARAIAAGAESAAHDEAEIRSALYRRRDEIAGEVFGEVKSRLAEYRASPEYAESLKKDAKKAAELIKGHDGAVLIIGREDEWLAGDIEDAAGLHVEFSDLIKLGGVIGKSSEIECDFTLDSRFDAAKEDFTRESGLSVV